MSIDLDAYFQEQAVSVERYKGQLTPEFQKALADYHAKVTEKDCEFYHTIDFGNGRVETGAWDLRGHETEYLGGFELNGKRVLEVGPASGFLSAHIASKGADLVVFDLPFGRGPELVPFPEVDLSQAAAAGVHSMRRLRNSWWHTKAAFGFDASAVYADVYDPPSDLGRFDVTVFGAILVHLSNPFRALQRLAAVTDDAIVVTDVVGDAVGASTLGAPLSFAPSPLPHGIVHWWALSPAAIRHMVQKLGFSDVVVTTHTPSRMASRPPLFTIVARRPASKRS